MQVTPSVRLVSKLGAGGMGAVWLADHTALATRVVVKFMLGGLDSSTSARARFKREAEAASQVKSPHVVQTFDYGVTAEGVPFIVMEHLEGRDLAAEIAARGALDPVTVIAIVTQVAKALSKAHAAGLLHRDIKPDNIFLCESEPTDDLFVKLLDFGIAKTHQGDDSAREAEMDAQTKTGQVIGTPFYMSPEQVTAQKVIDQRSDLWSLGVVAFEALTGKRPYDGPSFGALAVKIATTEPPKPSDANPALPPSVDAWFARACARDPADRFGSARELADQLRAAFEGVVSLPPIASGAMSDSGARSGSGARGGSGAVTTPSPRRPRSNPSAPIASVPAGPISVDDDAHSRPSFVLASTVQPEAASGEREALARSEGGGAVAVAVKGREETPSAGGPPRRVKVIVPIVAVATILGAIGIGRWTAREQPGDRTGASGTNATNASGTTVESATAKNASTTQSSTAPSASSASSADVVTVADAATPRDRASAAPSTTGAPSAIPVTVVSAPVHTAGARPRPTSVASAGASATPKATATVAPTSTSTNAQDPLY